MKTFKEYVIESSIETNIGKLMDKELKDIKNSVSFYDNYLEYNKKDKDMKTFKVNDYTIWYTKGTAVKNKEVFKYNFDLD